VSIEQRKSIVNKPNHPQR